MIELAVFDLAGTTVLDDDGVAQAFRAALAAAGVTADPALVRSVMGLPKPEAIRRLLAAAGRTLPEESIEAIHQDFVGRMRFWYASEPTIGEIPGASATFAALRQAGIRVAVNTGFSRPVVEILLARLGWQVPDVIDADITSDEVPRGRPHPDMIHTLMARLGIRDPAHVAKIGDTAADLEEGTNAGCGIVIGVTSGSYTAEQLQKYPHTHILASVADVPGVLLS